MLASTLRGPLYAIASMNHPWSVLQRMNQRKIDTLATVATVPLDYYSFDTVKLLRKTVDEFDTDAREERTWFKNLPSTFELPRETIHRLRAVGRQPGCAG